MFCLVLCLLGRDPEQGWDRSKVKGLLANLITVRDVSYATGLEVVAGGRLYNIVVDTEVGGVEGRKTVLVTFTCLSALCLQTILFLAELLTHDGLSP